MLNTMTASLGPSFPDCKVRVWERGLEYGFQIVFPMAGKPYRGTDFQRCHGGRVSSQALLEVHCFVGPARCSKPNHICHDT